VPAKQKGFLWAFLGCDGVKEPAGENQPWLRFPGDGTAPPASYVVLSQKIRLSISSWECEMQQPQLTTYADIAEVRTVTGAAACNQLLAEGWVLLGVYPLTTVAEMTPRETSEDGEQKKRQDIQRYVRRLVGYVVGRKREPEA
jgi:hypothetical protein